MDFYSSEDNSSDSEGFSNDLNYLSPLSVVHPMKRGVEAEETVTLAHIMDCPTITVTLANSIKPY